MLILQQAVRCRRLEGETLPERHLHRAGAPDPDREEVRGQQPARNQTNHMTPTVPELLRALGDLLQPPLGGDPRVQLAHARQRATALLERAQQAATPETRYLVPQDRHPAYGLLQPEEAR